MTPSSVQLQGVENQVETEAGIERQVAGIERQVARIERQVARIERQVCGASCKAEQGGACGGGSQSAAAAEGNHQR